jgi:prolyl 4-hydroxylase
MGPLLSETDDFGVPQLVQYAPGEKFDVHHDWYDVPQVVKTGDESKRGKRFNRLASFFVFLENEGVVGGETWFPFVEVREDDEERDGMGKWRRHEEGGTAFRPRAGSALFWVNLHGNRTGDGRVVHAGLKVEEGRKTAMNIWPRKFY